MKCKTIYYNTTMKNKWYNDIIVYHKMLVLKDTSYHIIEYQKKIQKKRKEYIITIKQRKTNIMQNKRNKCEKY